MEPEFCMVTTGSGDRETVCGKPGRSYRIRGLMEVTIVLCPWHLAELERKHKGTIEVQEGR